MTEWKVGDKVSCIKSRHDMKPGDEGSIVEKEVRFWNIWWTVSFRRGSKELACPINEMDEYFKKI
jgi:hypothetical protein